MSCETKTDMKTERELMECSRTYYRCYDCGEGFGGEGESWYMEHHIPEEMRGSTSTHLDGTIRFCESCTDKRYVGGTHTSESIQKKLSE